MTALEHDILKHLIKLEATVKAMPTANPKPNLLPLFQQIEALVEQLPRSTAPDLLHYMQKKSYEKARQWLEGVTLKSKRVAVCAEKLGGAGILPARNWVRETRQQDAGAPRK